jgi:uncharacterized protein
MPSVLSRLLPPTPDVLAMLQRQGEVTVAGMELLERWARGEPDIPERIAEAEHHADTLKRELRIALRDAYVTPVEQEDLYMISDRLDAVLTGTRDAVWEAEVMEAAPDSPTQEMASLLLAAVRLVVGSFQHLGTDPKAATLAADEANRTARRVEHVYRGAMSTLIRSDDLREVMTRRELYRRFARLSETLGNVADRVWYAAIKES